jgi:hypothetical protein
MAELKQERDHLRNEVTTLWSKLSKVRARPAGQCSARLFSHTRRARPARPCECGGSARRLDWRARAHMAALKSVRARPSPVRPLVHPPSRPSASRRLALDSSRLGLHI